MCRNNLLVMQRICKFEHKILWEAGLIARFVSHYKQELVLPSFFIGHSGFDTVPHQKQRCLETQVYQHSMTMPRMIGKNTNGEHRKAVAIGDKGGNESALREVVVERDSYPSTAKNI